jgi:hypothetical protein
MRIVEIILSTALTGRGVRTAIDRCKGDFLQTYHGELISGDEGDQREIVSESVFRFFFFFKGKRWW